jgi:hypothetical protein
MAKLIDIEGIGPDDAELLEATGWTDAQALANADPARLTREIADANAMLKILPRTPEQRRVERWIAAAGRALGPAARKKSRAKSIREPAPADLAAEAPAPRRKRKTSAAAVSGPPIEPSVQDELPLAPPPLSAADPGEDELAAIAGPVNFEADPDVAEMLAAAPVALPIPARLLAERGIAPAEIAVAPLLNRALGDLEVRVSVDKPARRDLPDAPAGSRRATSVQVSDAGFSLGRRGFDPARIRTIEEAQGDAPPVRASSSKAGMEDDRIALLRSPLEKTNRGRKPSSRFFIRGVLHDRPLRIWFGGLFALLLQLGVPLAIIAAPLLILSDQQPEVFSWVPKWIIAFPLVVPVAGLLYALVSTGAKCRVCAQRIYVPKHCLKNRKAHHRRCSATSAPWHCT